MTPHRSHGRGSLLIDRRYRGVGRIQRASGVTDPALFQEFILPMLDQLEQGGRRDILEAIRDGR